MDNSLGVPDHLRFADEKELIQEVARGNEAAFAQLFVLYKQRVFSYAMHFTRSSEHAEEIVQEVFLKIWLHRERIADLENFGGYVHVMARNYSFNELKKIAGEKAFKKKWEHSRAVSENTTAYCITEKEHRAILQKALDQLSPQQRLVYVLRSDHCLKNDEIATRLNISPATVKVHLKKGLRVIREFINARKGITWFIFLAIQYFF